MEYPLRDDLLDDVAVDVGQAKVATCVTEGQPFMIDAQQVQYRGVKVVCVDSVFGGQNTVLIGLAMNDSALDATSGHP